MVQRVHQFIRKQIVWGFGIMLLVTSACRPQTTPATETTSTALQPVPSSPLPAPTRSIVPDNAAQVMQKARLGNGTIYGGLKLSPDAKTLAVPTTVGVDLYNVEAVKKVRTLPTGSYTSHIAFSPDGSILAADAASGDRVQLWDINNGSLLRELTTNSQDIGIFMDLAFSPDGKTIAIGYSLRGGNRAAETWLWNVEDGKRLLTMHLDPAVPGLERIIRVYDPSDGSQIKQWLGDRAVFAPTGSLAIEQKDTVRIWDFEKKRTVWAFSGKKPLSPRKVTGWHSHPMDKSSRQVPWMAAYDCGRSVTASCYRP